MARLRGPGGCPWDREQTHESILKCLVEEAYEFVEAVASGDKENMEEELGDVLLQVIFHAQMAQESGHFDMDGIIHTLAEKLVRRHPHVFGADRADSADQVVKSWEAIKAGEKQKQDRQSALDGVPRQLPPLQKAEKIQKKARKVGFEWPDYRGPWEKLQEELGELSRELVEKEARRNQAKVEEEFGDVLFSLVNLARHLKVDPALALERTNQKFARRFREVETLAAAEGRELKGLSLEEMDAYWERAKKR